MSRKLLVTLILILFLLPFVSWYYLQSGLNWRKKAQQMMNGKNPFPITSIVSWKGVPIDSAQIKNHVSLVALIDCQHIAEQKELITRFYSQFKDTHKANLILVDTCAATEYELPDSMRTISFLFGCADTIPECKNLLSNWPAGKLYALVDRKSIIRSYYAANTTEEKRVLVEHMALLLPREHTEQVELKRGSKN